MGKTVKELKELYKKYNKEYTYKVRYKIDLERKKDSNGREWDYPVTKNNPLYNETFFNIITVDFKVESRLDLNRIEKHMKLKNVSIHITDIEVLHPKIELFIGSLFTFDY